MPHLPHRWALLILLCSIAITDLRAEATIAFTVPDPGPVSLAIYDQQGRMVRELLRGERLDAGPHALAWDGLDRCGRAQPAEGCAWRLVQTPGFRAEYLLSLGITPGPSPADPWVGNHSGPASALVDAAGNLYVGAEIAENAPVLMRIALAGTRVDWQASRYVPGFGVDAMADAGDALLAFSINRQVRRIDPATGRSLQVFDVPWPGQQVLARKQIEGDRDPESMTLLEQREARVRIDPMDAHMAGNGECFVVSERQHDALRWFSSRTGSELGRRQVQRPMGLAMARDGRLYAISGDRVLRFDAAWREAPVEVIGQGRLVDPVRLAIDEARGGILVAHGSPCANQVVRFDAGGHAIATCGRPGGRGYGIYHGEDFQRIVSISSDRQGGFLAVESGMATLRRVAHVSSQGTFIREWLGAPPWGSFIAFDPDDPRRVLFNVGEEVRAFGTMDADARSCRITHVLHAPDTAGLFPSITSHSALWRLQRRGGGLFLVNAGGNAVATAPAIMRVDLEHGQLVPVARAGIASTATAGLAPGSVASPFYAEALRRAGVAVTSRNLDAFAAYDWRDVDGDGRVDADEVRIGPMPPGGAPTAVHIDDAWQVTYALRCSGADGPVWATLPNPAPPGEAPDWAWSRARLSPARLPAEWDGMGKGAAPSAILPTRDGGMVVIATGQGNPADDRQGDSWPASTQGVVRLLRWDRDSRLIWNAGRAAAGNASPPGQFHDPMHLLGEIGGSIVVQDRAIRPAMVFTADGLYAGSFLDGRVADGLPDHIYAAPEAARQPSLLLHDQIGGVLHDGGALGMLWNPSGRYGSPIYRIHGWEGWHRQSGAIALSGPATTAACTGTGLLGRYYADAAWTGEPVLERVDAQLRFGQRQLPVVAVRPGRPWLGDGERGFDPGRFSVRWQGMLETPLSEAYMLNVQADAGATFEVVLDGRAILSDAAPASRFGGTVSRTSAPIACRSGQRIPLTIRYASASGRAHLSLTWESLSTDRQHIPRSALYPGSASP